MVFMPVLTYTRGGCLKNSTLPRHWVQLTRFTAFDVKVLRKGRRYESGTRSALWNPYDESENKGPSAGPGVVGKVARSGGRGSRASGAAPGTDGWRSRHRCLAAHRSSMNARGGERSRTAVVRGRARRTTTVWQCVLPFSCIVRFCRFGPSAGASDPFALAVAALVVIIS